MHFPSDRFRPALYSKFTGVIVGMARKRTYTRQRGDIKDQTAAMSLFLAHNLDSLHSNAGCTEKQGFDLLMGLRFRRGLSIPRERVSRVVHNNVNVIVISKMSSRFPKSLVDRRS